MKLIGAMPTATKEIATLNEMELCLAKMTFFYIFLYLIMSEFHYLAFTHNSLRMDDTEMLLEEQFG